ncbi:peptide deformylase [Cognatiyoonia koreensis]|uniref:Peptide deformylase n=1 Tax=Cognatiyoonia koreensis TaxID=364200 RepID=A0A1I0RC11_9RHOB|nr:peptide deformylase [Cognatiyoonia koreensis]SEW38372.1 peptide deformylase [Cognatiyoonia koreensis]
MTVLSIRTVPDDILRQVCSPVTRFDASLKSFAADMLATMYDAPGRGLAAPQVGVAQRIFVMDPTWRSGIYAPMVFVNPEIVSVSDRMSSMNEGCLSIPDQLTKVSRPDTVTVRWFDVDGSEKTESFDGFAAACAQHEIDHLNGILCTDYVT